jgi:hypothetical protein
VVGSPCWADMARQVDRKHYNAEYVELMFQEQYLGRNDMWRLVEQLEGTCVYVGQEVSFLGSTAARITGVHLNGKKVAALTHPHISTYTRRHRPRSSPQAQRLSTARSQRK